MSIEPPSVTVVNYGIGNILSVTRAIEKIGGRALVSDDPRVIERSDRLILPGVGAFAKAMQELARRRLIEPIKRFAQSGRPFLGICLGMELMLDESAEFGSHAGLGLIPGKVSAIPPTTASGAPHKIPHIGWNSLFPPGPDGWRDTMLDGIVPGFNMYFVHSYSAHPVDTRDILAVADYNGRAITAAIQRANMIGFQGHPEKSGNDGLRIIKRFIEMQQA